MTPSSSESAGRLSLRTRVVLGVVALEVVLMGLAGWWILSAAHHELEHAFIQQASATASALALAAESAMEEGALQQDLLPMIRALTHRESVHRIDVVDAEGTLLTGSRAEEIGTRPPPPHGPPLAVKDGCSVYEEMPHPEDWLHEEGHTYLFVHPIGRPDRRRGEVRLALSSRSANQVAAALFQRLLFVVPIVGVLTGFAFFLVDRKLRKVILDFAGAASRMADGDLSQRVQVRTGDELETLGLFFNRMADQIQDHSENLARTVETRTHELAEEKRKLDLIVDTVGAGLALLDCDLGVVWTNRTVKTWFGMGQDPPDVPCHVAYWRRLERCSDCPALRALRCGQPQRGEVIGPDSRGRTRFYQVLTSPIRDETGRITRVLELIHDVTPAKEMEIQLAQAAKLAAVGELASGVAHEVNNPIGVVMARVSDLLERIRREEEVSPERLRASLEAIDRSAARVARITGSLLSFARRDSEELATLDLNKVVDESLYLVQNRIRADGVSVKTELDRGLPPVLGNFNEIQQVLLNLLNNAADALPTGGTVTVRTRVAPNDRQHVELAVEDTGCGVPREVRGRIFDPFFTTKPPDKGTGLGLSISHGLIRRHKGRILVEDRDGGGAAFRILLPATAAEAPHD